MLSLFKGKRAITNPKNPSFSQTSYSPVLSSRPLFFKSRSITNPKNSTYLQTKYSEPEHPSFSPSNARMAIMNLRNSSSLHINYKELQLPPPFPHKAKRLSRIREIPVPHEQVTVSQCLLLLFLQTSEMQSQTRGILVPNK